MMRYRGIVRNRITNELRKTRWCATYKDAHNRAESLGRRLYGRNDNWEINRVDVITTSKTVYHVQLMRGTDNAFDETFEPETLLTTLNKQEALAFYETLPEFIALEEPETDLEGNEKYLSPIVVEITGDIANLIKG